MSVVIEICNRKILVIEGKGNKNKAKVKKAFTVDLPAAMFSNDIINIDQDNIAVLRQAFKENHIKPKKAEIVINDNSVISRGIIIPKVDSRRIHMIARNEMMNIFNLGTEYLVDYRILEETLQDGIDSYHILASACKLELIESLEQFCNACRISIESVESAQSTMLWLINNLDLIKHSSPTMICEVNQDYRRYYLFHDFSFVLLRSINGEEDESSNAKAVRLLEIMSESLVDEYGAPIKDILLIGSSSFAELLCQQLQTAGMNCLIVNLNKELGTSNKLELANYANGLGAIV